MRISLSKVRLNGSSTALGSLQQAKEAVNDSHSSIKVIKSNRPLNLDVEPKQFKIGASPSPLIKLREQINASSQSTRMLRVDHANENNTYGFPVKAKVNLGLIRQIGSGQSSRQATTTALRDEQMEIEDL